jgi:hypothetical protein
MHCCNESLWKSQQQHKSSSEKPKRHGSHRPFSIGDNQYGRCHEK